MRHLIMGLLWLAAPMAAQQATLSLITPATKVRPGQSLTVAVTSTATTAAALQWTVTIPTGVTATAVPGPRAVAAGKGIACRADGSLCLVYGVNANTLAAGEAATYTFAFAPNAAAGTARFSLSQALLASVTGQAIAVTAGPDLVVQVLSRYDLDGDGKIDLVDVQAAVDQARGIATCQDVNGDGACNLYDVQAIINAIVTGVQ